MPEGENVAGAVARLLIEGGAIGVGMSPAGDISEECALLTASWVDQRHHASMGWIERHLALRRDPEMILPGCRTIISVAFGYNYPRTRPDRLPMIARYAAGEDYHDALRRRLAGSLEIIRKEVEGAAEAGFRICVDSAPVAEKYWAVASRLCMRGLNGAAILPGYGPRILLAEIYTTMRLGGGVWRPDGDRTPAPERCPGCGRCLKACPTGALQRDATLDARRCLSYLTIEHRGPWEATGMLEAMDTPAGKGTLFGCDRCLDACPLNAPESEAGVIPELLPRDYYQSFDSEMALALTKDEFNRLFRGSPVKRARLEGLQRNAANTLPCPPRFRLRRWRPEG